MIFVITKWGAVERALFRGENKALYTSRKRERARGVGPTNVPTNAVPLGAPAPLFLETPSPPVRPLGSPLLSHVRGHWEALTPAVRCVSLRKPVQYDAY